MKRRRGAAMIVAIVLIALVGLALAAGGSAVAWQAKRTARFERQAQLRQLLLAGAAIAQARLAADSSINAPIVLPAVLREQSAELRLQSTGGGDRRQVEVQADLQGMSASQQIVFIQQAGRWHLSSASLDH